MQQIIIQSSKTKPFVQRHSWVFSGAVERFSNQQSVGIAEVTDPSGLVLGYGFSDPQSQIVCRLFHFGPKPEGGFSLKYWTAKFQNAFQLRQTLLLRTGTDTYRLIHAEGDEFPGLIVDIYGGNTAIIHTLIDATGQWIETWVNILKSLGMTHFYHKHSFSKAGQWIGESPGSEIVALEYGHKFLVDVEKGQKTGFFIDQRENRKEIGEISSGRKVLNAFGFSGGFSVHALAGRAREVVTVDISKEACQMADRNVALNQLSATAHKSVTADCFEYLKDMDSDFDVIILDPPAFSKSKSTVDKASRGYKEINLSALKKVAKGGFIATFSCSQHISADLFQKIVFGAAADAGRQVRIIKKFHQPVDHPISIFHPEGEYLKGLLLAVD